LKSRFFKVFPCWWKDPDPGGPTTYGSYRWIRNREQKVIQYFNISDNRNIFWFQLTQKKAEKEEKILHNLKEMENKQFMQYKEEEEEEEYWSHPEVSTGPILR
jgi:hypothetical protein